ncbi:3-hydroxyacyl-CoA dehydrogenase [Micromonospora tulbaghiae]|uniref:3-hydroxyacyl-CoA dehydrogenase n=2 Tax=Micromonospora tulbaghiae TaxID=479978 RepID=A0A386WU12_9ACTN|nr:3-hydroxyacyl-CoA dehydrogenase [Micromonospora tulbaghiae]
MTDEGKAHRLTVLGAGVMGLSITTTALGHGVPVRLVETDPQRLARVGENVDRQLRVARLLGALPAGRPVGEFTTSSTLDGAQDSTVLIEAVTEQSDTKSKALAEASAVLAAGTPIISNTSSIPVDELADAVTDPARLIGVHFMNPPYLIRAVEVIRGPRTGDATLAAVRDLLAALDREVIVVRDAPGFVTSRLLHPMINDAARIVAEGVATAEQVDALMQGCLGHRTGPLRTADLIGLDNLADSLWVLHQRTGEERYRPCEYLLQKVRNGDHGRKTGRGFYEYGKALP